jgi:hypothetical protein
MKASIEGFWINWSIILVLALCTKEDLAKSNCSLAGKFDFSWPPRLWRTMEFVSYSLEMKR